MITFKDAIANAKLEIPFDIAVRVTLPETITEETGEYDTLFGYCRWNGKELESLDGDNYYLDDEVISYETFETESGELIFEVLMPGEWITGGELNEWLKEEKGEDDSFYQEPPKRTRAERRKNDFTKAIRKKKLARAIYPSPTDSQWEYYDNLHQYSKNKIHCSCPMCSAKTNAKTDKGKGDRSDAPKWGSTAHRMKKNYSTADKKKYEEMESKEKNYFTGEDDE